MKGRPRTNPEPGTQFGPLTYLSVRYAPREDGSRYIQKWWTVRCSVCNQTKEMLASMVQEATRVSCGCKRRPYKAHRDRQLPVGPAEPGIYFAVFGPLLKVGRSRNIAKRLRALSADQGYPPKFLGYIPRSTEDVTQEEVWAHAHLRTYRVSGREWFRALPSAVALVQRWVDQGSVPAFVKQIAA